MWIYRFIFVFFSDYNVPAHYKELGNTEEPTNGNVNVLNKITKKELIYFNCPGKVLRNKQHTMLPTQIKQLSNSKIRNDAEIAPWGCENSNRGFTGRPSAENHAKAGREDGTRVSSPKPWAAVDSKPRPRGIKKIIHLRT